MHLECGAAMCTYFCNCFSGNKETLRENLNAGFLTRPTRPKYPSKWGVDRKKNWPIREKFPSLPGMLQCQGKVEFFIHHKWTCSSFIRAKIYLPTWFLAGRSQSCSLKLLWSQMGYFIGLKLAHLNTTRMKCPPGTCSDNASYVEFT